MKKDETVVIRLNRTEMAVICASLVVANDIAFGDYDGIENDLTLLRLGFVVGVYSKEDFKELSGRLGKFIRP